jgi:hypothetical protein
MAPVRQDLVSFAILFENYLGYSKKKGDQGDLHQLLKFKIFDGDWEEFRTNWGPGLALYRELVKDIKTYEEGFERVQNKAKDLELTDNQLFSFIDLCLDLFLYTSGYQSVQEFSDIFVGSDLNSSHKNYPQFKIFKYLNDGFGGNKVLEYLIQKSDSEVQELTDKLKNDGVLKGEDGLKLMHSLGSELNGAKIEVYLPEVLTNYPVRSLRYSFDGNEYDLTCDGHSYESVVFTYKIEEANRAQVISELEKLFEKGKEVDKSQGAWEDEDWDLIEFEFYFDTFSVKTVLGEKISDQDLIKQIWDDIDINLFFETGFESFINNSTPEFTIQINSTEAKEVKDIEPNLDRDTETITLTIENYQGDGEYNGVWNTGVWEHGTIFRFFASDVDGSIPLNFGQKAEDEDLYAWEYEWAAKKAPKHNPEEGIFFGSGTMSKSTDTSTISFKIFLTPKGLRWEIEQG